MAKFADHMDKIAEGVTEGYQKIEDGVVEGFGKITSACSGAMLNEDGILIHEIGAAKIGLEEYCIDLMNEKGGR